MKSDTVLPAAFPVRDERALMGRLAGVLWLFAAAVALAGIPLSSPEAGHHMDVTIVVSIFALIFGAASLTDLIPWSRMPMWQHLAAYIAVLPLLGLVQWSTGGATSYVMAMIMLPLFFTAYFYPPRFAWLLMALLLLVIAAPFAYDNNATANFDARYVIFVVSSVALTGVVLHLKARLVETERKQYELVISDPLTGLSNRRAFDAALVAVIDASGIGDREAAVLFLDLDHFKRINDEFGHQAGDRVLRSVASRCAEVARPTDTLARIGGDEFALVAPGANRDEAERMAALLGEAVERTAPSESAPPLRATVSWALVGEDGLDGAELMQTAGLRLLAAKRARATALLS